MRNLLLALGLLAAVLVFVTAPASARAGDHERAAPVTVSDASASAAHHGDPDHDVDHNPADHSHPIGEDTYHEKASHSSLDFAHYHGVAVKLAALPRAATLPTVDEAACGLALTPPIRPPLG